MAETKSAGDGLVEVKVTKLGDGKISKGGEPQLNEAGQSYYPRYAAKDTFRCTKAQADALGDKGFVA